MSRFLVIVRAGNNQFHEEWAFSHLREFDLFLSYYNDSYKSYLEPDVYSEYRPGTKVAGLAQLMVERKEFITKYSNVLILDDDISAATQDLNRVFGIATEQGFSICQPSLTHDSYFSYAALLQNRSYTFRSVTFVEMMCPCFSTDIFPQISAIYALGLESGIDLLWCNLTGNAPGSYAVIDEVAVQHTRPVGARKHENGFLEGARYEDDIAKVVHEFGVPWLPCVVYHAITPSGRKIEGRLPLAMSALKLLWSVRKRPGALQRLRSVLTHWKHLLFHKPINLRIQLTHQT